MAQEPRTAAGRTTAGVRRCLKQAVAAETSEFGVRSQCRHDREYLFSALTAPLSLADKLRCMVQLLRWFHWDGRQGMLDDLRYYRRKAARAAGK
jgi:hypothetical protein